MSKSDILINAYLYGDGLNSVVDEWLIQEPNHELAIASKDIQLYLRGQKDFETVNLNLKKINYSKYSIEEQLLYLRFIFYFYANEYKINDCQLVCAAIKRLVPSSLSIEWQIIPIELESKIQKLNGNLHGYMRLMEFALEKLNANSTRYKIILWQYLMPLSYSFDYEKINKYKKIYIELMVGKNIENRLAYLQLLQETELCNFEKLPPLIKKVREDKSFLHFEQYLKVCENLYAMFVENRFDQIYHNQTQNIDLKTMSALLQSKPLEAIQLAKENANIATEYKETPPSFLSYYLIRAELANQNDQACEFSLLCRQKIGNVSFADLFFWFRIYHMRKNYEVAKHYYCLLQKEVTAKKLENRLKIEISLSPELNDEVLKFYNENKTSDLINPPLPKKNSESQQHLIDQIIIGNSSSINIVKEQILKLHSKPTNILITGETGTGKEIAAKALHECGAYKNKPFIAINCGAISDQLLQSELFGHTQGAFTGAQNNHIGIFERAADGDVFLDEIGEISPLMQTSLLRVLASNEIKPIGSNIQKKIRCRILMATNQNLNEMVKKGLFRKDLQFRLEKFTIELPPLNQRPEDIRLLSDYFLNHLNPSLKPLKFASKTWEHLESLPWHGNIRELRNEMERLRLFYSDKKAIQITNLSEKYQVNPRNKSQRINIQNNR